MCSASSFSSFITRAVREKETHKVSLIINPLVENMLHWSLGEACIKELHRPMCLSCHVSSDLGSKGRKVRVHLLKATLPLLQKNKQRPQTHCYKASYRRHRPKLRQFFFLYTYLLQVNVSGPTWHHESFRFINSGSVQPWSKTSISKVLYKCALPLLQKRSFAGPDMLPFPCVQLSHLSATPAHKSNIQSDEFLSTKRSLI